MTPVRSPVHTKIGASWMPSLIARSHFLLHQHHRTTFYLTRMWKRRRSSSRNRRRGAGRFRSPAKPPRCMTDISCITIITIMRWTMTLAMTPKKTKHRNVVAESLFHSRSSSTPSWTKWRWTGTRTSSHGSPMDDAL